MQIPKMAVLVFQAVNSAQESLFATFKLVFVVM